ncbi:hypothetical protein VOLCADRAFT_101301, partial [Volvox carteri f. nagariensis]
AFCRDRDRDDFHRLWVNFLAPNSPQRLLAASQRPAPPSSLPTAAHAHLAQQPLQQPQHPQLGSVLTGQSSSMGAIPTLLLSTNGASMADRLDLYGAFASYLREQQ